ncbi:MAG: enolase C-terminal domain-like protein, partial [Hyphomicrobiales bacterium]
ANTDMLFDRFKLLGTQGMMGMVLSGLNMALWDAKARAEGKALADLFGGATQKIVPYGNVGFDGVAGSAEGAAKFAAAGFKAVKAKIGYETIADDLAVVRGMRDAVGPDVELMVDYNQSLSLDEARVRLNALEGEGLTWVEEPILSHDFKNYAALQKATNTPLQAGENWWAPTDFQTAVDLGTTSMIMPDAQKCGGVTGWMRIAKLAEQNNIKVSSHLWPELSAQLLSITPTAHWLEYADWFNPVVREPLKIENGYAIIDGVIGTGIELNDEALATYAV